MGCFSPISKTGRFRLILGVSCFVLIYFLVRMGVEGVDGVDGRLVKG